MAYEVYCGIHGTQEAMVTGNCRGGFSAGELIAFLYARNFPRKEWSQRVDEAFRGMEIVTAMTDPQRERAKQKRYVFSLAINGVMLTVMML